MAGVFVGREAELTALTAALEDAIAGRGRLVLVAGDPGIGKSRLANELATTAAGAGAEVLWGRCWEAGGAPAFWPWVQALRSYIRAREPDVVLAELGTTAGDLAQLVPDVRELIGGEPAPGDDSEGARFRLFDSTATFLRRAGQSQPLVLVLDDLHAADTPSLLLLQFVAGTVSDSRLLVIGAYRGIEVGPDHPLTATAAHLARLPAAVSLTLGGLGWDDVAGYIKLSTGVTPTDELARALHRETEGNPLFVGEVVRLLAAEGRLEGPASGWRFSIPQGIREAIARRLSRLSPECIGVLSLASVVGREFSLVVVSRLSDLPEAELLALLDAAMTAGLLEEAPGAIGQLRFSHALIRDSLYDGLTAPRRLELHRRVGDTLEQLYAGRHESHLAELAQHFFAASPAGRADIAVHYARRAGDRAVQLLAFEEAGRLYRMGLDALELVDAADAAMRCELLLGLGEAETRAGDRTKAKQSFLAAAELARTSRSPETLARAALGYGGRFVWEADRGDSHLAPLLEEAIAALPQHSRALRARLLARLAAGPLRDDVNRDRRDRLSAQALDIARDVGDPNLLAWVLDGRHAAVWWPENLDERLAIAGELIRVAGASADRERVFQGHHYRFVALLELGDMPALRAAHEAQTIMAEELRQPAQLAYVSACNATLATLEGRLDDAEEHVERAFEQARAYGSLADLWLRVQLYAIRRAQGRLDEVEDLVARSLTDFPSYGVFRCIHAHIASELGNEVSARAALNALAHDRFVIAPTEEWIYGLTLLADVAAFLNDAAAAESLYGRLLPYAGRTGVSAPDDCTGAVGRPLAVLAGVLERWGDAVRHFEDAIAMNEKLGARPWLARTRYDYARVLLTRDAPGDRERATALLEEEESSARRIGMDHLAARIVAERPARPDSRSHPGTGAGECVFRREGEYFTVVYGGRAFRLRDTKGLRYLAALLARPGTEVHALDLVATEGAIAAAARTPDVGDGASKSRHDVIDSAARAAYTRRLEELNEELAEAEAWYDRGRAARARDEIEFITSELAGALGLGGRSRQVTSDAERARQRVTKAIKAAIDRIGSPCPDLERHLRATVHTGAFCVYRPDPRLAITWRT